MTSRPEIQAIIFDCDGTLVDSETVSLTVLVEYIAEFGLTIPVEEALERFAGGELPIVFAEVEERLGRKLPEDHLDQFRTRQLARLAQGVDIIDGVEELLSGLTLPYCVASNAPLNKVGLCLETSGLDRFFPEERRFSAYQIRKWKPEPDLFLLAAEALDANPAECAVVEDSIYGVDAGIAGGMQVFAYDPKGELPRREGVRHVTSIHELIGLFSKK